MNRKLKAKCYFKKRLLIVVLLLSVSNFAQNSPLFEQGKELYKAEKYQDAINSWTKIIDNKEHSASLYYNLGNAYYKLNKIGPSIYFYEKALQLSPNDNDIKNNLAFAENARVDAIEPLPKTIFYKWHTAVAKILTFNGWAFLAVAFLASFVILFLAYYFSYSENKKRIFFAGAMFFILLLVMSLTMAFSTYNNFIENKPAIIFSESTAVRNEPNLGSESTFTIHEGTKVQIITTDTDWVRIEIANGKDGWIPAADLKKL